MTVKWQKRMHFKRKQTKPKRKWSKLIDLSILWETTKTDGFKMLQNSNL